MQRTLRRAIALATLAAAAASDPAAAVRELRFSREQPSATVDDPGAAPAAGDLRPVRSAARAYHAALTRLAAGSPDEAAAAVAALDPRSAIEAADSTRPSVRGAVAVIEGVATADPEALLPPLVLHVDLFRRYRAAHKPTLSDHHTAMTAYIAALYAERAGTPAARAAAVEVLTAVGLALLEDRRRSSAMGAFARALDFEPAAADALLGLAIDREWEHAYPDVIALLQRLVAARPASAEGRLRLANNLERMGRRRAAVERFTALAAHPSAGWAAEIAYQELARIHLDERDPAAAAALLRQALERFPESERLRIQLAYALDRAGDPAAAREIVAELAQSPPDGAGPTPRRRYTRTPDADSALELTAVRRSADERLGALAAALDRLQFGDGG